MTPFERQVLDALPLTIYTVDLEGCITSTNRSWSRFARENGAPELADEGDMIGRSVFSQLADQLSREQIERAMAQLRMGLSDHVSWEFPCNSPSEERVFLMQVSALREDLLAAPAAGAATEDGVQAAPAPRPSPEIRHGQPPVTGFVFSTVDITHSHLSREALIETGIALSRTIALDRVFPSVGMQVRRALPVVSFCIALADDETAALRVAHHYGWAHEGGTLESRLGAVWLDALANGRLVVRATSAGLELTAPMLSAEGSLGAMTVVLEKLPDDVQRLAEMERVFITLAAQTAASLERAWLVRRVEGKRRLEAIGEVATGIAHELRNPLFGISSAAQLLRFRVREDPVVEKNVGRILKEVERLNRMVGSLLDYGRPKAIVLAPGDPDLVWDEVLEQQQGRLEAKGLRVIRTRAADLAGGAPARCPIDAEQLAQVFVNVLVNAIDAAPEATDLTLHGATLVTGAWRCRLHNGGPAIPPEVLPRVFEIFFSTKTGGTGIGLALCQRIVDEHRGTMAIESQPEMGTVVTVQLPGA
jgi:signal transduction histidine kinase